ncbi:MAG: hypothetical protein AB1657_06005 [Candidatus Micrarchaeota archaeon]
MHSAIYERLNTKWKEACKILFREEVGNLRVYEGWLSECIEPVSVQKSQIPGKEVVAVGDYRGSKLISFADIDFFRKYPPLSINDIKDIDSIIRAARERAEYAGNIVLGNSSNAESSTGIEDCSNILSSHTYNSSQDVAFSTLGRVDESVFGCVLVGQSSFSIKTVLGRHLARTLESSYALECSDIYFSHQMRGCSECMFSFNLRGKRHVIGNVQLPQDKYQSIKKKLLPELADELKKNKRLRPLRDFIPREPPQAARPAPQSPVHMPQAAPDLKMVEDAFQKTTDLIFGRKLQGISSFGPYLSRHTRCDPKARGMALNKLFPEGKRTVSLEEHGSYSHPQAWPEALDIGSFGLSNVGTLISPIAFFCPDIQEQSSNMVECSNFTNSYHCFHSSNLYFVKFAAYSFWPRDCEHVFGCDSLRTSSFCINCYNSFKLSRCFEVDTSQDCTGSYFLHNCENVHDSMFCFNVKNKRYAIGNAEVGKEKFFEAKKALQLWLLSQLEKKGSVDLDIYNINKK